MQRRRLVPVLAVSVMATLVPAVTTTATAAPAPATSPLARYAEQKPTWKRCDPRLPAAFQCAKVKVPLNYAKPGGKKLDIAISRYRTSTPGKRHGVLLSNPGGPGGPGISFPLMLHAELPRSVRERYDLIGFDPRGVAMSSPVTCGLSQAESRWPRVYKARTYARDVTTAKAVATKCRARSGEKLPHITTRNTARDMDLIRTVLGEKKLNYLGYSYGTYLGAVYTQMFPKRTGRFVLDSAVDPGRVWRGMIQGWAEGAEPAFRRWTKWAAERNPVYGLGDTPQKVSKSFWDLIARADRQPFEYQGEMLDGDRIRTYMRFSTFGVEYASTLVVELKKAAAGQRTALAPTARRARPAFAEEIPADNYNASFWAVACGDHSAAWPKNPAQYRKDAVRDKKRYPLYGDFASNIMPCAFWNKSREPVTKVDNKVPSLIVQNEWDSQTPLVAAKGLRRALTGSKMVTVKGGGGHGVYLSGGSACADAAVASYLRTGKLPASDTTCAPSTPRTSRTQQSPLPQHPNRF
ncbi:alpha/beta hydrolase [Streptomyces uncialis]|uniref:alpha/beta hydrolase n=1 Tax=Streptomyces uncialis TaxID=1048205 RepID=UPI0038637F18|nr:alpha/beta hydrolase [Streptomyces uncialis]